MLSHTLICLGIKYTLKFIVYKGIVFGIPENVGSISLKINDFSKLDFTDVMVLV